MSHAALNTLLARLLSGGYDPVAAIVEDETARGFKVIRPGDAPWFRATDWRAASVASIDGKVARLILLHAFESGKGAMTRTIAAVEAAGLRPAILEPTAELATTLQRRKWKSRTVHLPGNDHEVVWSPPRHLGQSGDGK